MNGLSLQRRCRVKISHPIYEPPERFDYLSPVIDWKSPQVKFQKVNQLCEVLIAHNIQCTHILLPVSHFVLICVT